VYAWFGSHFSPVPGPPRNRGTINDGRVSFRAAHELSISLQPVLYIAGVHLAADAEGTCERTPPNGEPVALERRMQPGTPARKHGRRIGDDVGILGDDPQK
jgi:hypothetical protein